MRLSADFSLNVGLSGPRDGVEVDSGHSQSLSIETMPLHLMQAMVLCNLKNF